MNSFYTESHEYFDSESAVPLKNMNIKRVIICVGTNDILNTNIPITRLYIPIQQMLRKAQLLFQCKVVLQSVIPIPGKSRQVADMVYQFNRTAAEACRSLGCYFLDVFNDFLQCDSFRRFFAFRRNSREIDIHPNREGCSILARAYIVIIRGSFNPVIHTGKRYAS